MHPTLTWVPLPKAAARLGLGWPIVIHLIKTHQLRGYLAGGCRWFVEARSVEAYAGRQP